MDYTVMIVDDVEINIEILDAILSSDYTVVPALGGDEAIRMLSATQPDLVLLDLSMPGKDGFDVLRYMKEHKALANIPVIFVTGEQDVYSEEKGLELGAVDYIKKPYVSAIIRVKIHNHLELKSYRDKLEDLVKKRTRQLEERTRQLAGAHEAVIMGMSLMSESHDTVTGEHINRIKRFTRLLTQQLLISQPGLLTPELAESITTYSPLHDVGKISISDTILKKTGVLTPEEFEIMKMHTTNGAELLRKTEQFMAEGRDRDSLQVAIDIAECHHERYDGTGYPHRYAGEDIPVAARIVALADVYDALRSPRTYKPGFSHEESVRIICDGDGRTSPAHFDPKVLQAFAQLNQQFAHAYE